MPDVAPPGHRPRVARPRRIVLALAAALLAALAVLAVAAVSSGSAAAATPDEPQPTIPDVEPIDPVTPIEPVMPGPQVPEVPDVDVSLPGPVGSGGVVADENGTDSATISLDMPDVTGDSSNAVVIILVLSVLSIAPSLLVLMTSFTRIVIVLSLTRNALGIPQLPPQQVIVGLSLFMTLFVMGPTLGEMNDVGLQPLLNDQKTFTEAAQDASEPLRGFMLQFTREGELELFLDASGTETPVARDEVPLTALIPAFVLSELKSAFILGFLIFVPFLVIDIVVSAVLTSLGMMMLPPTYVSLPLKLLLFILLDGWVLIIGTLLESYR